MRKFIPLLCVVAGMSVGGCGSTSSDGGQNDAFTIRGSTSAVASAASLLNVNADLFRVGFFEMRLSNNADCSAPYTTVFTSSSGLLRDMATEPEIATATGLPAGTYPCVAMRLSDLISFSPSATEGTCNAATTYVKDFYRAGNEEVPFRDPAGAVITATGTDDTPSEDLVWVFFSTNPAAVVARGYSTSQVASLSTGMVVPGTTTFYWTGLNAVLQKPGGCDIAPTDIGFR